MSVSGTHGPGCPCPYCASYSDPMADFVTVKVNKKEYERLTAELRRLDEAEESCEELANALKIVEAERDRYKAALKEISCNGWPLEMRSIALNALAEAVRP